MSSQAIQGGPGELEHEASVDEVLEQIKLLELPLDVLFNILSNLHPLDRESFLYTKVDIGSLLAHRSHSFIEGVILDRQML